MLTLMKVTTFLKSVALTLLLGTATGVAAQEAADGCDLMFWQIFSPKSSALSKQPVKFTVYNSGSTVSNFKAGVIKDGETVYEQDINGTVEQDGTYTVNLDYTVDCPYEKNTTVKLFVHADSDTNPTNDTTVVNVDMPKLLDYPYTWNEETSKNDFTYGQFWGMGWGYDDQQFNAFYMSGKSTNWMGDLATLPINFPVDGKVTCSFDYGTSGGAVTLNASIDYGDSIETLNPIELGESTQGFSTAFFSFNSLRPAIVKLTAKLGGEWNAYGSVYLRNFCFKDAVKDLSANKILSPSLEQMAVSDNPVPVKVRYKNMSPFDIVNPTFGYQAGDEKVEEIYYGTIKGGETVEYEFAKGFKADKVGNVDIKAWCKADGDENKDNDDVSTSVSFYEPLSFPYTTTFDNNNELWSAIDENNDGNVWATMPLSDNNMVAAFANNQATAKDLFVSPAIAMPAGKSRVSFYYAGILKSGTMTLKVYMNDVPSVDGAELLFDKLTTNGGWLNGYHAIDMKEKGNRYFIFALEGSGDQIIIDNFKVDASEDLCIHKTTFDTKSGYNKKTAKVTISYVNHGISAQSNIGVRYYINDTNHFVDETVADAVNPGDTIYYTFKKEADISTPDSTYQLIGQILTKVGDDTQNDMALGDAVENYRIEGIPYYYAFNDAKRNKHWTFANGNDELSKWNIEDFYFAYDGNYDLKHTNYGTGKSDDWAYSECIHMPAGKYDVSMFYRGRTYFAGDEYNQSFEVKMGKECSADAMNIEIGKSVDEDIYQPAYRKMSKEIEIPEDGDYFIGFHSTGIGNNGETHIDGVSITPVTEGVSLPYQSDFANDSTEWSWYNSNAIQFTKWNVEDGKAVVNRSEDDSYNYFEGLLVSPKFALSAGKKVKMEIEYSIESATDTLALQLFGGTVNNPTFMKPLALLPAKDSKYTYEFTPAENETEYYFGFRSNTNYDDQDNYYYGPFYKITVSSVKVMYDETSGITDATDDGLNISFRNGTLTITSANAISEVSLYDTTGTLLDSNSGSASTVTLSYGHYKGVAVIKIKTANGMVIKKLSL